MVAPAAEETGQNPPAHVHADVSASVGIVMTDTLYTKNPPTQNRLHESVCTALRSQGRPVPLLCWQRVPWATREVHGTQGRGTRQAWPLRDGKSSKPLSVFAHPHRGLGRRTRRATPSRRLAAALLITLCASAGVQAEDWPTHRHDIARSGVTGERLAPPLKQAWVHASAHRPQPAWHGPARRDGWHKTENLKPRVIFDWAYHVVSAGDAVYFGSSADDKAYCLDAATGTVRWTFFTEAPIRLAPTVAGGRVYVGSDDGNVYCLSADAGKLLWTFRASKIDRRVAGNERIMSVWPIRGGVLVDGGAAYLSAGLFASEGAYLCAIDATTGKEIWKQRFDSFCPQGYLLASKQRLYVPCGGGPPAVFSRKDGRYRYSLDSSGGAFAVLTDESVLTGPGKTGTVEAYGSGQRDQLASFAGNTIVATPRMSYLHTDTELSALDRKRYLDLCDEKKRLARRMDVLKKRLEKKDRSIDYDPPNVFRIGAYRDNDENFVYDGAIAEVRVWNVARTAADIQATRDRTLEGKPKGLVGYWPCVEGSGEELADRAGKSTGRIREGVEWIKTTGAAPGPPGEHALVFPGDNGVQASVDAGQDASLRMREQVTVEAWIRPEAREKWSGIAGNIWDSGSTEAGYGLTLDDGTGVWFGLKVTPESMLYLSSGADTIQLDRWHHVAGTFDGYTMKVYVDGELKASKEIFSKESGSTEQVAGQIRALQAKVAEVDKALPQCIAWKRSCKYPYSLILAGDVLYAGGTGAVAAFNAKDGKSLWTNDVKGRALDLAVADGRLLVSTDEGVIHCFVGKDRR